MGDDLLIKLFNRFLILLVVSLLLQFMQFEYVYMGRRTVYCFNLRFLYSESEVDGILIS